MKEKLNLTNLTKMTKKDMQATKGGLVCRTCFCHCWIYPDGSSDIEDPRDHIVNTRYRA